MPTNLNKTTILNYLKSNLTEFQNRYSVEKIGVFGSYARDEESQNSDIDIFVKMKPSLFDLIAVKTRIESDLDKKVDIIREHKNLKPLLLKMIKKDLIYA